LLSDEEQQEQIDRLVEWMGDKDQILCLTGAGLSTESGIPDYRGAEGSYHKGHKPQTHDQFMKSEYQRKRYWGRGLVGWKSFDEVNPNDGHYALARMEELGLIGVNMEDSDGFYEHGADDLERSFSSGGRRLALVTQNVDTLHRRAGSKRLIELHGRTDQLKCMQCGNLRDRNSFQQELTELNRDWLHEALQATSRDDMRADGDAAVKTDNYEVVQVPACTCCGGFMVWSTRDVLGYQFFFL
jgi:NAD-dependent deacetylase sirtuin 4